MGFIVKKIKFSLKSAAFTLAEILIVLGIIGNIAVMTIPTLLKSTQQKAYEVGLKKFYSEFNQVLAQISIDNGAISNLSSTGLFAAGSSNNTLGDEIVKYFKVAKNCKSLAGEGCWSTSVNGNYDGSGTNADFDTVARYKFVTNSGVGIALENYQASGANCSADRSIADVEPLTKVCGVVFVDLNGPKGPNRRGRDVFNFFITSSRGLYPRGGKDSEESGGDFYWNSSTNPNCQSTSKSGTYCAGRVMEEGWQMNY